MPILKVPISPLLLVLKVCNVKSTVDFLQEIMGQECSDVFRFNLGHLLEGQIRMVKVKSA